MKQWILKAVSICLMLGMNSAFAAKEQTVVLVSIDGLRWDYIEKHGAPNLKAMAERGVRAQKLLSTMPWFTGSKPVIIEIWLGNVLVG